MTRLWTVAQIGSREHYAVARALQSAGKLELMITDYWCNLGRPLLSAGPAVFRALAGRWDPTIPAGKVRAFNTATLVDQLRSRRRTGAQELQSLEYLRIGRKFGAAAARCLERRRPCPETQAFFAYNTGALEPLELLAAVSVPTVVDQIDPARTHVEMVRAEQEKWPGWERRIGPVAEEYWARLHAEWRAATVVLVNSAWSKSALIAQGVPADKVITVPLAYEGKTIREKSVNRTGQLSVLFLGNVSLGKGIQYLLEAAKLLQAVGVTFTVAGPVGISEEAVATAPANVTFLGRITRDRLGEVYGAADVFVFPTLSDGFGLTQLEAMAHGLPVITTPRCGDVVQHEKNGFVVQPGDGEAIAVAIVRLSQDRALLAEMSAAACKRAGDFSLRNYLERFFGELNRFNFGCE